MLFFKIIVRQTETSVPATYQLFISVKKEIGFHLCIHWHTLAFTHHARSVFLQSASSDIWRAGSLGSTSRPYDKCARHSKWNCTSNVVTQTVWGLTQFTSCVIKTGCVMQMASFSCHRVVQQWSVFITALQSKNPRIRMPCASQNAINNTLFS